MGDLGNLRSIAIHPTLAKEYIAAKSATRLKSPVTRSTSASALHCLQRRLPGARVNEVTLEQLIEFVTRNDDGSLRAGATQKNLQSRLIQVFKWAAYRGYCDAALALGLEQELAPDTYRVRPGVWLSKPQIDRILAACLEDAVPAKGRRDWVLLLTGFFTGLRCSELAKLRWENVSLAAGEIAGLTGKRGKPIHIGLPESVAEALRGWRVQAAAASGRLIVGTDPVVPRGREHIAGDESIRVRDYRLVWDEPLGTSGIYDVVKLRGAQIGQPGLAPHDLRRSYAKFLEDQGLPLEKISKALRHEDVSTTRRYLQSNPEKVTAIGQGLKVDIA